LLFDFVWELPTRVCPSAFDGESESRVDSWQSPEWTAGAKRDPPRDPDARASGPSGPAARSEPREEREESADSSAGVWVR